MIFNEKTAVLRQKKTSAALALLLIMLFSGTVFAAWGGSDDAVFEKKMTEFRYSLYPEIENPGYDFEDALTRSDESKGLWLKCSRFMNENAKDIEKFKINFLKKYEAPFPDNDLYEEIGAPENPFPEEYSRYRKNDIFRFMMINPLFEMYFIMNFYTINILGPSEFGRMSIKQQVGGERFFSEKHKDGTYRFMIDRYFYRFIFTIDPVKDELEVEKIFKRKGNDLFENEQP